MADRPAGLVANHPANMVTGRQAGEYGEGLPWYLVKDETAQLAYQPEGTICEHVDVDEDAGTIRIPLGVAARNEGGHASTLVCAFCVLGALTKAGYLKPMGPPLEQDGSSYQLYMVKTG